MAAQVPQLASLSGEADRCVGVILGCLLGDALGAPVEGWGPEQIKQEHGEVRDMLVGLHMGLGVMGGPRRGMYTDDTNSTMALASSLVECQTLNPEHAAKQYGLFWTSGTKRGYPGTAMRAMKAVLDGQDYRTTGTIAFRDGSYANGGAMRISPVGVAFRDAPDDELHEAVRTAIISSHVHPQAIDGAWVVAKAITVLLKIKPSELDPMVFLSDMAQYCRTPELRQNIEKLIKHLKKGDNGDDVGFLTKEYSDFQLAAVDAVPCALWAVVKHWNDPEECIIKMVNVGGDTDTIGCIAGSMIGGLHGTKWIPARWWDALENNERGKDWILQTAIKLAALNLKEAPKI